MVSIFVVEIANVDEDVKHVRAYIVFQRIPYFFIIVSNVELGYEVE